MKITAGRVLQLNEISIMRKLGYKHWTNPTTGKTGYIKRLSQAFYPRFHAFVLYDDQHVPMIDLHMDWRRPMHKQGQRSFEDAESATVMQEAVRIQTILDSLP